MREQLGSNTCQPPPWPHSAGILPLVQKQSLCSPQRPLSLLAVCVGPWAPPWAASGHASGSRTGRPLPAAEGLLYGHQDLQAGAPGPWKRPFPPSFHILTPFSATSSSAQPGSKREHNPYSSSAHDINHRSSGWAAQPGPSKPASQASLTPSAGNLSSAGPHRALCEAEPGALGSTPQPRRGYYPLMYFSFLKHCMFLNMSCLVPEKQPRGHKRCNLNKLRLGQDAHKDFATEIFSIV